MNWKVTSEPAAEPMTLSEAKTWLKIDSDTTEDALVTSLIVSARQTAESFCNRAFITQTIAQSFDTLSEFNLVRSPVQSITSITYLDANGTSQTLSTDVYELNTYSYPNSIRLKHNQVFPSTSDVVGNVIVTYVAGYGDASTDIPNLIIDACKVIVRDYYKNRDNPTRKFPTLAENMLRAYKIHQIV